MLISFALVSVIMAQNVLCRLCFWFLPVRAPSTASRNDSDPGFSVTPTGEVLPSEHWATHGFTGPDVHCAVIDF
jgi:hypothetical protein